MLSNNHWFLFFFFNFQKMIVKTWKLSAPQFFDKLKCEFEVKTTEEQGIRDMLLGSQHFRGRRAC